MRNKLNCSLLFLVFCFNGSVNRKQSNFYHMPRRLFQSNKPHSRMLRFFFSQLYFNWSFRIADTKQKPTQERKQVLDWRCVIQTIEYAVERQKENNNPFINIIPREERNSVWRIWCYFLWYAITGFPAVCRSPVWLSLHRKGICDKCLQPFRACSGGFEVQPAQQACSLP